MKPACPLLSPERDSRASKRQRSRQAVAVLDPGWINQAGPLTRVRGRVGPGGAFELIEFELVGGTIRLTAKADTDEVSVTTARGDASLRDLSVQPVFEPLLGRVIEYAWSLTNHRGYSDAFQIRFLDLDSRDEATRQFEAAAAGLFVRSVG